MGKRSRLTTTLRPTRSALRLRSVLRPARRPPSVEAEMIGGDIGRKRREAWAQRLEARQGSRPRVAAKLCAANDDSAPEARIPALLDAFFTDGGEGEPRDWLLTKGLPERFPALENDLRREQDRLRVLRERRRAALTLQRSGALFIVAKSILAGFARMKAERGALDFDDQIARALALVTRSSAAWVLHKLDYGLDHLLLDEAQDTSAAQWGILAALTAEFFAGAGAAQREPHRLCGRRREAVDLLLPGRGAGEVRGNEARLRNASSRRRAAVRRRAADLLVPVVADDSRRRRQDIPIRKGLARRHGRRGAAAHSPGDPPRLERSRRAVAADRREPGA